MEMKWTDKTLVDGSQKDGEGVGMDFKFSPRALELQELGRRVWDSPGGSVGGGEVIIHEDGGGITEAQ